MKGNKDMNAKEIILVSVVAVMLFVAGMVVGNMMPKCHGGYGHTQMMMDGGCPCKKMMKHDGEFRGEMKKHMKEGRMNKEGRHDKAPRHEGSAPVDAPVPVQKP